MGSSDITYNVGYGVSPSPLVNKMGQFDVFLDSEGNLRVIHFGKVLQTFKPEYEE